MFTSPRRTPANPSVRYVDTARQASVPRPPLREMPLDTAPTASNGCRARRRASCQNRFMRLLVHVGVGQPPPLAIFGRELDFTAAHTPKRPIDG